MKRPIWRLAALLAASFVWAGQVAASGGAASGATAGVVDGVLGSISGTMQTAITVLGNLSGSYDGLLGLFEAICYLGGFFILVGTLLRLSRLPPHESKIGVVVSALSAIVLMAAPSAISSIAVTFFGSTSCGGSRFIDYLGAEACSAGPSPYRPILQFVQFYGFFSFIRGWFLINRSAKPGAQDPDGIKLKGIMHVFFGVLCIHIFETLSVMMATFGFSWIGTLLGGS